MKKNTVFYICIIGIFGLLMWLVLQHGHTLESGKLISREMSAGAAEKNGLFDAILNNLEHPLSIFLLQILSIILASRFLGWLGSTIGQPTVIGEVIAGIALGPSLLGLFFPAAAGFLFPESSFANLQFLSQIGLILFMFIIGMELDLSILKRKSHAAVVISHASIVFPYFLGVALAYFLYPQFSPDTIPFAAFALFMGIAMSITAFPVLARIVQERDMTKSELGTLVITCAAADDVTAWCLLAVVIALVKAGGVAGAFITIGLSIGYVLFMLSAVRPLLDHMANRYFTRETVSRPVVALIFGVLLFSAFLTEFIGIHALFGAFLAGVIIPSKPEFRAVLTEKIEAVSLVLLLPLFFAFTGLRTQIGLLNSPDLWLVCLTVITVAVTGKFLGSALSARIVGQSWRDSLTIGALMNTRGLMELVVLNIGYDLGVLSHEIFAMLVLMALITTFMTGPAIDLINYIFRVPSGVLPFPASSNYRVLISFGSPRAGSRLLQLAHQLIPGDCTEADVTALHLTPSADVSIQDSMIFERESFAPILETAKEIGLPVKIQYKASNEVASEIVRFANQGKYDLMLVGSSRPLFSDSETGGKLRDFFEEVDCTVGALIDRGFQQIDRVLLIVDNSADAFLGGIAKKYLRNTSGHIAVLDSENILRNDGELWGFGSGGNESRIIRIETVAMNNEFLMPYDLILISLEYWKKSKRQKMAWLKYSPSILIVSNAPHKS